MKGRVASAALAVAGVAVLASLATSSWSAREPTSAFTPDGDGADPLVADARAQGVDALRLVSGPLGLARDPTVDPAKTLLAIVRPASAYSAAEAQALRDFLLNGGQVLVADTSGHANTLTTPLGITFERVRLVEQDAPGLEAWLEGRQFLLRPDQPTALQIDAALSAAVLAASSPRSFLDRDGDGTIGEADPQGPFPVMVEAAVGTGRIVAIADASALAPAGLETGDDRAWRQAVLSHLLPEGGRLYVDESHQRHADPTVAALAAVSQAVSTPAWRWGFVACAVILLGAMALPSHPNLWSAHRFRPNHFIRRATLLRPTEAQTLDAPAPATVRTRTWSPRGACALAGGVALAVAGLAFASAQAAYLGAFLLAASASALVPGAPRVGASRIVGKERVPEEESVPVRLEIWAEGPAVDVEIQDRLPKEFRLEEGTSWFRATVTRHAVEASYRIAPALRGPYEVGPLMIRRTDPLRLRSHEVALPAGSLEVEPRQEPVNRIPFRTRIPRATLGPHQVNRAGDGSEFHSLRDYQDGDSFRSINWKASARSSKGLVVSQRVHESRTTVTILLDARAVSGAGGASKSPLAHGCRVALSIAAGALRVRDRVRLVAYGDGVRDIPPGAASRQMHELSQLLSGLAARGSTSAGQAIDAVLPTLGSGVPVLLVSGLEGDPTIVEAARALRARGLLVTVIASPVSTEPTDAEDGGPEPGRAEILAAREATMRGFRAAGITVFEAVDGVPLDYLFRVGVTV